MHETYSVEMDARGHIDIPSPVRKARGFGAHTLFILSEDGDDLRLVPAELVPTRKIRKIPREELAQALIDGATTPEGIKDAKDGIRELGLDPSDYSSKF